MKKILSILMLLVAIVTGAWAANEVTLVSTNFTTWKTGATPSENSGLSEKNTYTLTDGTNDVASVVGKGCKLNDTKNTPTASGITGYTQKWFRFGSSGNYLTITPSEKFYNGGKVRVLISSNSIDVTNGTVTVGSTKIGDIVTATEDGTDCHWVEFDIPSTVNNQTASITFTRTTTTFFIWGLEIKTNSLAEEAFTVSFNAGTNGTCATTSITEESAGAGVTLPTATPNEGYTFDGWYDGETKVGDAGETYHPTAAVELTAKYSALTAPTISVDNTSVSTYKSVAVTFTATADGAPDPTVTWYQNESASTTGGTSVGTGLTYQPDVTAEGTYYYYAVASNGVEPDATSEVVTLTVTDPDKYVTGNAYYISNGETAVKGEKIFADDITMTFVANGGFNAAATDDKVSSVNSNYVASIAGDNNSNSWGPEFVATKDGSLSVGVIINKNKTFTITNVSSFTYKGKNGADEDVDETVDGNSITTANNDNAKLYVVATIDVVAGTTYKFSVAGSKMGFYGFVFVPEGATETITTDNGVATYVTKQALDFTGLETKAYIVTGVNDAKTSVATAEVTTVPAGTALLVKGATVNVPVIANAIAPATNLFKISTGDGVQGGDNIFAYSKSAKQFKKVSSSIKVPAGKCYLQIDGVQNALDIDFGEQATAIENVNANDNAYAATPVKVIKNGKLYIGNFNVAGQQVK